MRGCPKCGKSGRQIYHGWEEHKRVEGYLTSEGPHIHFRCDNCQVEWKEFKHGV